MKTRILLALAAVSLAFPAVAADRTYDESRRIEQQNYSKAEGIFNRLDKDGNGILNVSESHPLGEKIARIDRNRDSQITKAELAQDYAVNTAENWKNWGYSDHAATEQRTIRN